MDAMNKQQPYENYGGGNKKITQLNWIIGVYLGQGWLSTCSATRKIYVAINLGNN